MAFYGDNPFEGDPVFNRIDDVEWASSDAVRNAIMAGFREAANLGSFDVDACVWGWACAEMLELALGRPATPPPPSPFAAAATIADPEALVPDALETLSLVRDPSTSELASLMGELSSMPPLEGEEPPVNLDAVLEGLVRRLEGRVVH